MTAFTTHAISRLGGLQLVKWTWCMCAGSCILGQVQAQCPPLTGAWTRRLHIASRMASVMRGPEDCAAPVDCTRSCVGFALPSQAEQVKAYHTFEAAGPLEQTW